MVRLCVAAAAVAILLAGAARADEMAMPGHAMSGHDAPADAALMDSMSSMNEGMKAPMTGDPDADFVTLMLAHHAGAVAMAKVELQYGKDPQIRRLAKAIVAAQEKEIAFMKRWKQRHGK